MADIIAEIDTIGELLTPVGVTRFYKQDYPTKYVANTIGLAWQSDSGHTLTQTMAQIERVYQIVYFGKSKVDCLKKSEQIANILRKTIKTKISGTNDYMTLVSFNFSPIMKTETDGVFAVIGILNVSVQDEIPKPYYDKMAEIHTNVTTKGGI